MTSANSEAVLAENLTKVYKDFWGRDKVRALDDLNLTIHRGEVFGLLGPNGSGKSTTIKLLLGLIFPTRGKAFVLGEGAGSSRINEKIGFLPEESYLYRFLNGEETLHFYGRLFKIPRKELNRRVPLLLDTVGLNIKDRKRKLREYSKGMARRIGLAWENLPEPRHPFSLEIIAPERPSVYVNLGPHPPRLWPEDLDRAHELWLQLQANFGSRVHHRDVVGVALRRLQKDLESEKRDEVLEDLNKELRKS